MHVGLFWGRTSRRQGRKLFCSPEAKRQTAISSAGNPELRCADNCCYSSLQLWPLGNSSVCQSHRSKRCQLLIAPGLYLLDASALKLHFETVASAYPMSLELDELVHPAHRLLPKLYSIAFRGSLCRASGPEAGERSLRRWRWWKRKRKRKGSRWRSRWRTWRKREGERPRWWR